MSHNTVKFRVVLDLELDASYLANAEVQSVLHRAVRSALSSGMFTAGTDATVEGWSCRVDALSKESVCN